MFSKCNTILELNKLRSQLIRSGMHTLEEINSAFELRKKDIKQNKQTKDKTLSSLIQVEDLKEGTLDNWELNNLPSTKIINLGISFIDESNPTLFFKKRSLGKIEVTRNFY